MATQERLYTVEDLEKLLDDGKRYELVRGELIVMPPPKREHGLVTIYVGSLILNFVISHNLGQVTTESGYHLFENPDTVRAPDIAFIAKNRVPPLTSEYDKIAPDLAVEVVSPSNTADDLNDKITQYFEAGVQLVWLVYPKTRTVYVYRSVKDVMVLDQNDTLDGGNVLPGFSVPVREFFSQLPAKL